MELETEFSSMFGPIWRPFRHKRNSSTSLFRKGLKLSKNQAWWISNDICHERGIGSNNFNPNWSPVWDWEKQCQTPTPDQEWGIEKFFPNPTHVNSGGLNLLLPIPHSWPVGDWNYYSQSHTCDHWGKKSLLTFPYWWHFIHFLKQQEVQWQYT